MQADVPSQARSKSRAETKHKEKQVDGCEEDFFLYIYIYIYFKVFLIFFVAACLVRTLEVSSCSSCFGTGSTGVEPSGFCGDFTHLH